MKTPPYALAFDPDNRQWLRFTSPERVYVAQTLNEAPSTIDQVEKSCRAGPYWAVGWVSYEAAPAFDPALSVRHEPTFPKVWFALFPPPTILTSLAATPPLAPLAWASSITKEDYVGSVDSIRSAIARGDTYQTNYSFRLTSAISPDPLQLFTQMVQTQGGSYGCLIHSEEFTISSASPELFFAKNGAKLISRPMKGTSPRGRTLEEDLSLAQELRESLKNRAENIMIVDMTRNDLSRIAERGSVQWPSVCEIEKYPPMLQMTSEVHATTNASLVEIFRALFPAASITGAPKAETMRIIAREESTPRRIYTGAIGVISPDDRAWFNVAIRTALIDHTQGTTEYGVGSGIVWDSSSNAEYEECLAKAAAITRPTHRFDLFETILWEPGNGFFLLSRHLTRLEEGAEYYGWKFDRDEVASLLSNDARNLEDRSSPHRVRLVLTAQGLMKTEWAPLTPLSNPYRISLAQKPISSQEYALYRKTTDRKVYDEAVPQDPEAHDVILWNERGELTETRIANISLEIDGKLYTPPIMSGLLGGCYRSELLSRGEIEERVLVREDLKRAKRIVLMNSLRRTWEGTLCGELHANS
jgi:para-aminobenzoate synthetase/4-amino-4-deoxychorismate lyase